MAARVRVSSRHVLRSHGCARCPAQRRRRRSRSSGSACSRSPPEETVTAVRTALDAGYRHIDTAQMYGNEAEVGRAIAESGVAREEIFVTTKLDNGRHGYDAALGALDESLRKLGFDYVDLFLIHWPRPAGGSLRRDVDGAGEAQGATARPASIGVSNFTVDAPGAARRADGHRARGEPDRAAPAVPAGGTARLPRRARHRDGGVEPDRPGRRAAAGRHGSARSPTSTAGRPRRSCCAGTSSSATSCSRSR